jgi:hypothetical protein
MYAYGSVRAHTRTPRGTSNRDSRRRLDSLRPPRHPRPPPQRHRPSPEKVITFARSLNKSPIEALIAAGYLNTVDTEAAVEVIQSLSLLSDDVLIDELRTRLRGRHQPEELPGRQSPMPPLFDKTKTRSRRPR